MHELVAEVRDMLRMLAAEKQQVIEITGEPALTAHADRLLLRQAVTNVLHNAIRYAPAKSRISIAIELTSDAVVIGFADEGPGIAPEHLGRIFDRFYRVDKARSRADGGHGLGLAIARSSVERQGERLDVESVVGRGSIFRIYVPRYSVPEDSVRNP